MSTPDLPAEFLKTMRQILGDEYAAFADICGSSPLQALRVNSLKITESAEDCLLSCFPGRSFSSVPWCPDGFFYSSSDDFRPGRSPFHDAGVYYIQEASAMAAAVCLDAQPGEAVLDLCAAPGGKSTQIAGCMQGHGLLMANEIIPSRAKILSENIERMGIRNALVTNESPQHLAERFPLYFDRILADAPCSGEGMFRKNPAAISEWSPQNVVRCAQRQNEILDCAAQMLRPGGRLVYSTCTFSPEEDEGTLARFLSSHPDFRMVSAPFSDEQFASCGFSAGLPDAYPDSPEEVSRAIRIFPHRSPGEGHFIAVLEKDGTPRRRTEPAGSGKDTRLPKELRTFLTETLQDSSSIQIRPERMAAFGEQLYLLPEQTPSLRGLKVLRPGLHLGTLKKDRFVPAHALSLSLSPADVHRSFDLTGQQAAAWTAGQTLPAGDSAKGWTLITVSGYSLGWGKCAGGMLKNHYPKGLRHT